MGFLNKSLANSAPSDSIVRKLYALIARAHQMMGNSQAAIQTCIDGLKLDPQDAELWFRKGVVHRHRGKSAEAEKRVAANPGTKTPEPILQRGSGHLWPSDSAQPRRAGGRARRSCEAKRLWSRRCWPSAQGIKRHQSS